MTLGQVSAYIKAINRNTKMEYLNNLGMTRAAYHADQGEIKTLIRDLQRE